MAMGVRIYMGLVFLIFVTLALNVYLDITNISKCEDAGGVWVKTACVNPSAIIEVK